MNKLIVFLLLATFTFAQDNSKNIKDLEQDFISFDYEKVLQKGRFILADSYTTKSDSLTIFTYMLNSAYALNDTSLAKSIIISILKTDLNHSLNPKKTSPKIIEFFNHVKTEENLFPTKPVKKDDELNPVRIKKETPWISVSSVLLPGSGHLIKGEKQKGYIHSAISVGLMAGIVVSHIKTNDNMDLYHKAKGNANYNALYDDYNSAYKTRSVLIGAYLIWGLYNIFEINNQDQFVSLKTVSDGSKTELLLSYHF
ncbi:MAG: hypothetical protein D8M58_03610 [Calditrichaeota bacterium]|nr:MAG: hypothetical protein DWQ03_03465 [Calditrichota bacterium]MBL1204453.1 hypothetical protein [Calditrichota bacterium]NOG44282.1 hypothetical protein [Calditrichota bacterium]